MSKAIISLGSNMGNRVLSLNLAMQEIMQGIGKLNAESKIYESEAWGFETENSFLNQVVEIETNLSPNDLLSSLLKIETKLGRKRNVLTYESRTIDLDILFYDDLIMDNINLKLPHPKIQDRKFVLIPLCQIAPDYFHPVFKKSNEQLLNECADKLWVKKFIR